MRVPPAAIHFPQEDRAWILREIEESLISGRLTLGPHGEALEREFAALCGADYAVAVNSGTSALEIILRSIGVEGKEVVVPSNTFYATAGAVVHAGGRPRFADCERSTFALDPASLRQALTPATAAVILVHIGGMISPQVRAIRAFCDERGIPLIEDAAHAHGSELNGQKAGTFGLAAAFSFYPTKVVTSGEGGIIVTNDEGLYNEARIYRDQGKEGFTTNFHVRMGYNWRLSEPHAIIGRAQLRRLPEFIERRASIAAVYDDLLPRLGQAIQPVTPLSGVRSNYYKYPAFLNGPERAGLKRILRADFDVGLSGEVYDTPLHLQPVFAQFTDGPLPQSEAICSGHICLPVSAVMTEADAGYVVEALEQALARLAAPAASGG